MVKKSSFKMGDPKQGAVLLERSWHDNHRVGRPTPRHYCSLCITAPMCIGFKRLPAYEKVGKGEFVAKIEHSGGGGVIVVSTDKKWNHDGRRLILEHRWGHLLFMTHHSSTIFMDHFSYTNLWMGADKFAKFGA